MRVKRPAWHFAATVWSGTAVAAVMPAVVWRFGWSAALPGYALFVVIGAVLAGSDAAIRRVPDVILMPSVAGGALLLCIASGVEGDWTALARAGLGATALVSFYFVLLVISPPGIGLGDVKLAGFIGMYLAWLSWRTLALGTLSAFLLAAIATAPLLAMRRIERTTRIPFAPFMVAGAILAIVLSC